MTVHPLLPALAVDIAVAAIGAVFVRTQLAIHRGFDLSFAAVVLLCGEVFLAISNLKDTLAGWLSGTVAAGFLGAVLGCVWGRLLRARAASGSPQATRVLIASLGLATCASGFVSLVRGPGLAQLPETSGWGALPGHFAAAIALVTGGAIVVIFWIRSRSGLEVSLLDQDPEFARELGCGGSFIAVEAGLVCGFAAAMAGAANASISGSSPSSGLELFLIAAAGALLLSKRGFVGAIWGGALIATLRELVVLAVAPVWGDFVVFTALALVLVGRGCARTADQVR